MGVPVLAVGDPDGDVGDEVGIELGRVGDSVGSAVGAVGDVEGDSVDRTQMRQVFSQCTERLLAAQWSILSLQ